MKQIIISFLVLGLSNALDVEIVSTTCDETLPVTATVKLRCENSSRCTFGTTASVFGTINYNDVANSGIENNMAYMTANLNLWTMDFNLVDMLQVPLCYDTMVAAESNENACPGSGSYDYSFSYKLPSAGREETSWLATGWQSSGKIEMFAEQDENMKIGECTLVLKSYVTQKGEKKLFGSPSAATTVGIVLGVLAFFFLAFLYCYCCRRRKGKVTADDQSQFHRMDDEKSFWTGVGTARSSKSKKSNATKETKVSEGAGTQSVVSDLP